jgi:hypothetical protein
MPKKIYGDFWICREKMHYKNCFLEEKWRYYEEHSFLLITLESFVIALSIWIPGWGIKKITQGFNRWSTLLYTGIIFNER